MRVVLVEPEFDINIGKIARLMYNFGFDELYLVRPRAPLDGRMRMFAKEGGRRVLANMRVVEELEEAVEGKFPVVGTTSEPGRFGLMHRSRPPEFLAEIDVSAAALVLGSEGRGLERTDLLKCDVLVNIPSNGSLNLSNAAAVLLYEAARRRRRWVYDRKKINAVMQKLEGMEFTNAGKIKQAWRRVIARATPDDEEFRAILLVLQRAARR